MTLAASFLKTCQPNKSWERSCKRRLKKPKMGPFESQVKVPKVVTKLHNSQLHVTSSGSFTRWKLRLFGFFLGPKINSGDDRRSFRFFFLLGQQTKKRHSKNFQRGRFGKLRPFFWVFRDHWNSILTPPDPLGFYQGPETQARPNLSPPVTLRKWKRPFLWKHVHVSNGWLVHDEILIMAYYYSSYIIPTQLGSRNPICSK